MSLSQLGAREGLSRWLENLPPGSSVQSSDQRVILVVIIDDQVLSNRF
jgi:hypothetical protein